jgi:hypothetical protein
VEWAAAQRAARRLRLTPGANGLDNALPAEVVVAAGQQLEVGFSRHADAAEALVVILGPACCGRCRR